MKHNVGSLDRTVRLVVGALLVVVGGVSVAGMIPGGIAAIVALVFGVVLLVTGYRQTCPLYLPFGIDTSDRT